MWNPALGRINVLVSISAPLLEVGVCDTLQAAGHFNVIRGLSAAAGKQIQVMVTDWTSWQQVVQGAGGPEILDALFHAKILTISPHAREHSIELALRSGVHGVVRASCTAEELIDAIQTLARGSRYVCPDVVQRMSSSFSRDALTAREEEVLRLLSRGQCNKTIARALGIAVGTVKTHVKGIMAKLDASSRTEAASIAAEKGIVDVPEFHSRRTSWIPSDLDGNRLISSFARTACEQV